MAYEEIKGILSAMHHTTGKSYAHMWEHLNRMREASNISTAQLGALFKESGVDLNQSYAIRPSDNNHSLLTWAAAGGYTDMVQALLEAGANPNIHVPLVWAARNNKIDIVTLLLEAGAYPNIHDDGYDGGFPLQVAATNGHLEVVNLLLARGAEVNTKDNQQRNVLHSIARSLRTIPNDIEVIKRLFDAGIDAKA